MRGIKMQDIEILKAKIEVKGQEVKSLTEAAAVAREAYEAINAQLLKAIDEKGKMIDEAIKLTEA